MRALKVGSSLLKSSAFILIVSLVNSVSAQSHYGIGHREVKIKFRHFVEYRRGIEIEAENLVKAQIAFAMGYGRNQDIGFRFSPKLDHQIRIMNVSEDETSTRLSSYVRVHYEYEGHFLIESSNDDLRIALPRRPLQEKDLACATDLAYGAYFYYWNPNQPKCLLRRGQDYDVVKIDEIIDPPVEAFPFADQSPRYEDLIHHGRIEIHYYIGEELGRGFWGPQVSLSDSAYAFRRVIRELRKLKFSPVKLDSVLSANWFNPTIKGFVLKTQRAEIFVQLVYGGSSFDVNDGIDDFHQEIARSYRLADVIIYSGHSGIGALGVSSAVTLKSLKLREVGALPEDKYQIFFFNGCSSYSGYNQTFFAAKPSTLYNLNIFTTGVYSSPKNGHLPVALIEDIASWASSGLKKSYKELLMEMKDRMSSDSMLGINVGGL